jgi:hypothetical protein
LQIFSRKEVLEKPLCLKLNGAQAVEYPKEGSALEFRSFQKTLSVSFVVYFDFEAIPQKLIEKKRKMKTKVILTKLMNILCI